MMMALNTFLVSLGAATGSVSRYGVGKLFERVTKSRFPWGTWVINLTGTLLIGIFFRDLESVRQDREWWMLLGTGFCGGYTTFSTMSVEARRLFRSGSWLIAVLYLVSSLGLGILIAYLTQWI